MTHSFVLSIVSRALFDSRGKIREVEDHLRPIVTERLEKDTNLTKDASSVGRDSWEMIINLTV